jgi:nuclear pore complex protein Nup155
MQDAARLVTNLQTESDGVDLVTLLRETPREAYSFQQLGVSGLIGAPDDSRTLIIDRPSIIHSFIFNPTAIDPTEPYTRPTR